ncbi:hypothetical protein C8J56DRAFT_1092199 [Mycena floridula]|nr:hypothetical protein C8J56DRAFT_1092199 [Mycena floridula]
MGNLQLVVPRRKKTSTSRSAQLKDARLSRFPSDLPPSRTKSASARLPLSPSRKPNLRQIPASSASGRTRPRNQAQKENDGSLNAARHTIASQASKIHHLQTELAGAQEELAIRALQLSRAEAAIEKLSIWQTRYRSKCCAFQRQRVLTLNLTAQLDIMTTITVPSLTRQIHSLVSSNDSVISSLRASLNRSEAKLVALRLTNTVSKKKIAAMSATQRRSDLSRARAIEKASSEATATAKHWCLWKDGSYTPVARALVRDLVKAGCSQAAVGSVIQKFASSAGFSVKRHLSRRTVQRILMEGGIASKIQVAHEILDAQTFTISGDGTSHRNLNLQTHHVTVMAPLYGSNVDDPDSAPRPRTRLLSVAATLSGMLGDHANDVKKVFKLFLEWKKTSIRTSLGWDKIIDLEIPESDALIAPLTRQLIEDAGGSAVWKSLSDIERSARRKMMLDDLAYRLGDEIFDNLPQSQQEDHERLFFGGCSMHKELNAVKGGVAGFADFYAENTTVDQPILLPNKDNDAVIQGGARAETDSIIVERAKEVSTRGGIKATCLAGAIFNNKDDKKGQHNVFVIYFRDTTGKSRKFPATSHTRYQTHCAAGRELIVHLDDYIAFLEFVRDKKEKRVFSHMELNLYKALQDRPTCSELAILAVYAQAVAHPLMRIVRGPGSEKVNLLDLGPTYSHLKGHVRKLIANPELLLAIDASHTTGSSDGLPWENPELFPAIHQLIAEARLFSLILLRKMLVCFLKGTLETWERFTAEFAIGGLIDLATQSQRDGAFMPATNDHSEGSLGHRRKVGREKPSSTSEHLSAQAAFHRNDTQAHMDEFYTAEDHRYLMVEARKEDESGLARIKHDAILEATKVRVSENREKAAKTKAAAAAKQAHLGSIDIILDPSELNNLNAAELGDQIDLHRADEPGSLREKVTPAKSGKNMTQKREILAAAIVRYRQRHPEVIDSDKDEEMEEDGITENDPSPQDSDDEEMEF